MTTSYWPFIDICQEYFAWRPEDNESTRAQSVVDSLKKMVDQGGLSEERFEEMVPLLGNLLSLRFGNEWDESLKNSDPEQVKHGTFMVIRDFFLALAKRGPIILVFEDLHWGDNLSLDLISLLMESLTIAPIFILCVYRPEPGNKCLHLATIATRKCPERYTELNLRDLTPNQSRRLVESLLRIEALPSSVKELILKKSQGNPFFVEEVVRSLIDSGMVYQDGAGWRAQEEIKSVAVPESIQSVILSRVDRLEKELRHVLQSASVIGRLFSRRVLGRVTKQEAELESVLWELEDRALIYAERAIPEEEYSFKHVLMQETVYGNILKRRRNGFHQQVAEAIEVLYQGSLDEYYEQLAYHFDRGGNVEKALEYLFKAGEKAKRNYANQEAITHLTRGLELLETTPESDERNRRELDFQIALGFPLIATKGNGAPEVEKTYSRARELGEQVGEDSQLFQALLGLRRFYIVRGELRMALEFGEELLTLARTLKNPAFLSRAHMMLGEALLWLGEYPRAQEHFDQGIDVYDPQRQSSDVFLFGTDTRIGGEFYSALTLWHLGYPDQALKSNHKAMVRIKELSHPFNSGIGLVLAATFHQFRREGGATLEQAEAVIALSTEQGIVLFLTWGTILLGWALAENGKVEEGIEQMRKGLDDYQALEGTLQRTYFLAMLAEAYGKAGQAEEGLNILTEALTLVETTGERMWEAELYRLRGELLRASSSGSSSKQKADIETEAEECFSKAIEVARRQQAKSLELRAVMSLSQLWSKGGRKEEARKLLGEIYGWFTEGYDTVDLKEAKALLDELS